jgi:alpha-tubulin suppressor-like RCC1 family protein
MEFLTPKSAGQLGINSTTSLVSTSKQIGKGVIPDGSIVAIAASNMHGIVLTNDHRMFSFGQGK